MKPMTTARQALLATILAGTTLVSTGCSSGGFPLASMNPFSKPEPTVATDTSSDKGFTASLVSTTSSMGQSAKNAIGKTTSAVTAVFKRDKDVEEAASTDPLSLTTKPDKVSPEVFVANGQLWESTGDHKKAMESYIKALGSEPNHVPALTSIARLHFRDGKHAKAAEFFAKALELSPEDAGLHNDLGLTLSKLNQHAMAIQSLERALQLAPGTSRYANNLASLKFEAGDAERAFQVLHANNKPAVAHFNMAYLHFKNGQTVQAKQHLSEVLRTNPEQAADPAIQRAIERSRDMLVQIDGPAATEAIAQASPQATIAGGKFLGQRQQTAPVQQVSQSSQKIATAPTMPKQQAATPTPSVTLPSTASASVPQLPKSVSPETPSLPVNMKATPSKLPQTASTVTPPAPTEIPASTPTTTSISDATKPAGSTAVSAITLPSPSKKPGVTVNPHVDRPAPTKPASSDAGSPSFPFSLPASFKAAE